MFTNTGPVKPSISPRAAFSTPVAVLGLALGLTAISPDWLQARAMEYVRPDPAVALAALTNAAASTTGASQIIPTVLWVLATLFGAALAHLYLVRTFRRQLHAIIDAVRNHASAPGGIRIKPGVHRELNELGTLLERMVQDQFQEHRALDESHAQFSKIFDSAPVLMSLSELKSGKFIEVNEELLRVSGYARQQIIGHSMRELEWMKPEDEAQIQALFASGQPVRGADIRIRARDGRPIECLFYAEIIPFSGHAHILSIAQDITERRRAEAALREERWRLQSIIDGTNAGTWEWNVQTGQTIFNERWAQIAGYSLTELSPTSIETWKTLCHPHDLEESTRLILEHFEGRLPWYECECRIQHKDGHWVWVHDRGLVINRTADGKPLMMFGTHTEITARKDYEAELLRLNRLYHALSQLNLLITRVQTQDELLAGVCQILVEHGGLKMAWIGRRNEQTNEVTSVGQFGDASGYLKEARIYTDGQPRGRGPTGTAIREGHHVICNDFLRAEETRPWHDLAQRHGLGSAGAFPIGNTHPAWGSLNVYAGEVNFFREPEITLFEEAARDVAFAIRHLEHEAQRRSAETALQQKTHELNLYFDSALDMLCIADMHGYFRRLNPAWERTLGYPLEKIQTCRFMDLVHPEDVAQTVRAMEQLSSQSPVLEFTNRYRHADGTYRWIEWRAFPKEDLIYAVARDTSVQHEAQAALQASEERFRHMAEKIESVFWIASADCSRTLYVSPAYEKIWGLPSETICNSPKILAQSSLPEDRDAALAAINAARNAGNQFDVEYRITRSDGGIVWIRDRGFPVRNTLGAITHVVGIADDISMHHLASEKLRESEQKFHNAFANAAIGFAISLPDGRWADANPAFCHITGYSIRELCSMTSDHLVHPEDLATCQWLHHRMLEGLTRDFVLEHRVVRKDRAVVWIRQSTSLIRDSSDHPQWVIVLVEDITERKAAETELRKLSQAVEQSPVSVVITDTKGNIEYVNSKFTQLTGYAFDEVRGQNPRVLKGPNASPEDHRTLWQTITRGETWHGEFHNRKKNGEMYWELASISPIIDTNGVITHFLAIKEDISARRALEAQLRQAQKLESIGHLAGGVAHDFNNILAAILLQLDLLQMNPVLDAETQGSLRELSGATKRAANLTRQLLMFSRRSVLEVKRIDLNEVVANLLKMLGRLIGEHIHMRFDRTATLPFVEADPGMMEQVLMNLTVNARDAMPKGGMITITLSSIQADEARTTPHPGVQPGEFVCISVADTGCGMTPETAARIFEPFFTTKEVGKGTGLGLATVHGIAGQHRGWVEVESEIGKGTAFRVFLPAVHAAPVEAPKADNNFLLRGTETILLVEDEPGVRTVTSASLRKVGYRVLEAAHGPEAMIVWQRAKADIDLLLSDMVMPHGITGLELATAFRAEKPSLKVIISSGYSAEMVAQLHSEEKGIVRLQKPYQISTLSKTVRQCLDSD